jgi:hypothetical protein
MLAQSISYLRFLSGKAYASTTEMSQFFGVDKRIGSVDTEYLHTLAARSAWRKTENRYY